MPDVRLLRRRCSAVVLGSRPSATKLSNLAATSGGVPGAVESPAKSDPSKCSRPCEAAFSPKRSSNSCSTPVAIPSAAGLFLEPRPRPLERPRPAESPSLLGRLVPLGRPRGRPVGVVRGTKDEKTYGSLAPKFLVETCI